MIETEAIMKKMKRLLLLAGFVLMGFFVSLAYGQKPKVFYVNSYHKGYEWSDGIESGLLEVLKISSKAKGILDTSRSPVELRVFRMDTKRNRGVEFKKKAAKKAFEQIRTWRPDLVITSDDNAVKYIVEPFLNDTDTPVVFCGVNWSLEQYSLATHRNITGLIEISHYTQLIEVLRQHAEGKRIGYIAGDNQSTRAEISALKRFAKHDVAKTYTINTFAEWKEALVRAKGEVDILLINNNAGIAGWNSKEAKRLILNTLTIPTGSTSGWMAEYNMVTFARDPREQGKWAGETALAILKGTPPHQIPVATGERGKIILNMAIAKRLEITLPMDLIENADLISAE